MNIENKNSDENKIQEENNLEDLSNQEKQEKNDQESKRQKDNQEFSTESDLLDIKNLTQENISDEEVEGSNRVENRRTKTIFSESAKKYKVYTKEFDEVIRAEDLESDEELTRLRASLDQLLIQLKNFISKLANKLQRKLLAKQNRSWDFDLEEGTLDTSKLTRIIIDPFNSLSFKKEKETNFKIR